MTVVYASHGRARAALSETPSGWYFALTILRHLAHRGRCGFKISSSFSSLKLRERLR